MRFRFIATVQNADTYERKTIAFDERHTGHDPLEQACIQAFKTFGWRKVLCKDVSVLGIADFEA